MPAALLLDTETVLADEEMKALLDAQGGVRRLSKQLTAGRVLPANRSAYRR